MENKTDRDGQWTYNYTDEGYWNHETFDTKEEAIKHGIEHALSQEWAKLYIGQLVCVPMDTSIDADDILTGKADWLDDEFGSEFDHGESWMNSISDDDSKLLSEMLGKAFSEWLDKTDNHPTSFTIINTEKVEKPEGM